MDGPTTLAEPKSRGYTPEAAKAGPILAEVAQHLVRTLYDLGDRTWPSAHTTAEDRGLVGPRFRVLLRRNDLATLDECWRLECGGPVEFFEWDDSGRIYGDYGVRYLLYGIMPVWDESGEWCGFGINGRHRGTGIMHAVEARIDCDAYVAGTDPATLLAGLKQVVGRPRLEEMRPGVDPTPGYINVMSAENKATYFKSRGVNQYVGPLWSSASLLSAFDDPRIRAVWLAHPDRPTATRRPEKH